GHLFRQRPLRGQGGGRAGVALREFPRGLHGQLWDLDGWRRPRRNLGQWSFLLLFVRDSGRRKDRLDRARFGRGRRERANETQSRQGPQQVGGGELVGGGAAA